MTRHVRRTAIVATCLLLFLVTVYAASHRPISIRHVPEAADWDGQRAMADIATQLSFGSRGLGTQGHGKEIDFIRASLAQTPATVVVQEGVYRSKDGASHPITNIIARFDPANPDRVIAGTHYDSIIRAYRDKDHPGDVMPGANNSASGVALLLETARVLGRATATPKVGVDLIFFDGEEGPRSLGAGDADWEALGSPYFIAHADSLYAARKPRTAVVFDMVCFKDLILHPEPISLSAARPQVRTFWSIGHAAYPGIFRDDPLPQDIGDDQVSLIKLGIPSFLVIDFDYEPWFNTTADTIDKCSADSLDAVGRTLVRYLYTLG